MQDRRASAVEKGCKNIRFSYRDANARSVPTALARWSYVEPGRSADTPGRAAPGEPRPTGREPPAVRPLQRF